MDNNKKKLKKVRDIQNSLMDTLGKLTSGEMDIKKAKSITKKANRELKALRAEAKRS